MKNFIKKCCILLIAVIPFLPGCVDEHFESGVLPGDPDSGQAIFMINLPKKNGLENRSMTTNQEDTIARISVLGFIDNGGTEELAFHTVVAPADIVRDATDGKKYTVTAALETGTYSSIVLIANTTPQLTVGTSRSVIEQSLLSELADGAKWDATSSNPTPIPMFGEVTGGSAGITVTTGSLPFNSVSLTRMLARINVSNNDEVDFTLQEIYLCNFRRDGRIMPGATLPSLPSTVRRHSQPLQYGTAANEIYVFEQDPSDGVEDSSMPFMVIGGDYGGSGVTTYYRIDFVNRLNEETPQASNEWISLTRNHAYNIVIDEVMGAGYKSLADAATCLPLNTVIRLLVFDDGGIENILFDGQYYLAISHETMEFDKNADTQVLHVETDNPLGWEIEQQGGTGWLTIDRTAPQANDDGNLDVSVTDYNNATQPRTADFKISAGRLEYTLPVRQSYLDEIVLEITDTLGNPINEVLFQSHPLGNRKSVNPKFLVKWKGPSCKVDVGMLGDRIIGLPSGLAQDVVFTAGQEEQTFVIDPNDFVPAEIDPETGNPFLEEGAAVTFTVENGIEKLTKTIYIRHQCMSVVFNDVDPLQYMGHQYTFGVRSNSTWVVSKAEAEVSNVFLNTSNQDYATAILNTTGGRDINNAVNFTTRLKVPAYNTTAENYGMGEAGRKLKLTFSDVNGIFPDVTKTFIAILPDANSYRVLNGGAPSVGNGREGRGGYVEIPIRKLFWIWETEENQEYEPNVSSSLLNLSASLVWQTANGLIPAGNIQLTNPLNSTDYRDYVLRVSTGNVTALGNAIVAIRNNNSQVLWSYHIWVTNYFPEDGSGKTFSPGNGVEFMDYNLGTTVSYTSFDPQTATTAPATSPAITGLFYQFGRKDPFPGVREIPNGSGNYDLSDPANQHPVYAANGTTRVNTAFQRIGVTDIKNLANSIHNPTTFYMGIPNPGVQDWYTSGSRTDMNDYLWVDRYGLKGTYDPCPIGWRVSQNEAFLYTYSSIINDGNNGVWVTASNSQRAYYSFGGQIYGATGGSFHNNYRGSATFTTTSWQAHDGVFVNIIPDRKDRNTLNRTNAGNVRCVRDTYNWYGQNW